ncbi:Fimbrin [Durusdinium trenchii]
MGEIARGSWGLCKANTQDVVSKRPDEVWQAVYPRLVFAPKSEMSENYSGESPQEERRQQLRRMAIIHDLLTGRHASARDEDEEAEAEVSEEDPEEERAALAEELEAADASESAEEAEESAAIVTDSCEDVSGEECEERGS